MHTFATLSSGRRLFGLFEHHTGGITSEIIAALVARLRDATLDTERFRETFDGHGAALDPDLPGGRSVHVRRQSPAPIGDWRAVLVFTRQRHTAT